MLKEAYFEANALYPKTNKFGGVSSLKVYQGLPRNAGLPFLVDKYKTTVDLTGDETEKEKSENQKHKYQKGV